MKKRPAIFSEEKDVYALRVADIPEYLLLEGHLYDFV